MLLPPLASHAFGREEPRFHLVAWLFLPTIMLVAALIVGTWDQYLTVPLWFEQAELLFGGAGTHTGNPLIAVAMLSYKTAVYVLLVVAVVLYFKLHRNAPTLVFITVVYAVMYYFAQDELGALYADVAARLLPVSMSNRTMIFFTALFHGAFYFQKSKIAAKTFVHGGEKEVWQEMSYGELTGAPRPLPIDGWLLAPAVGLVVVPVAGLAWVVNRLILPHELFNPAYNFLLALHGLFYAAGLFVAAMFFLRDKIAPRLMVWSMGGLVILFAFSASLYGQKEPEFIVVYNKLASMFSALIAAVWIPYFQRSRRVKETFVK